MVAAGNDDVETVSELLDDGADPNYAEKRGAETVLSRAAISCCPRVVEELIARGAIVDKYTGQALGDAVLGSKLLLTKPESSRMVADLSCVSALLRAGANVNLVGHRGGALHDACRVDCPEAITLLHSAHADLETRDRLGWTPLLLAAVVGSVSTFTMLHACGARLDAMTADGKSIRALLADTSLIKDWASLMKKSSAALIAGRATITAYLDEPPVPVVSLAASGPVDLE